VLLPTRLLSGKCRLFGELRQSRGCECGLCSNCRFAPHQSCLQILGHPIVTLSPQCLLGTTTLANKILPVYPALRHGGRRSQSSLISAQVFAILSRHSLYQRAFFDCAHQDCSKVVVRFSLLPLDTVVVSTQPLFDSPTPVPASWKCYKNVRIPPHIFNFLLTQQLFPRMSQ